MVTCSGRSRRSLRRPIANATARTPKATPPCTALGDHQTLPSTKLHAAGLLRPETLARYITKQSFGLERQMHVPLTLGRGFGLGSLGPHAFGWWNTGPCFGHAGGFGVVAFADRAAAPRWRS